MFPKSLPNIIFIQGVPKRLPTLAVTKVPKREDEHVEFAALTHDTLMQEKAYVKVRKQLCLIKNDVIQYK